MPNNSPLRYVDETDRTYGVAGMAIALVLWDGEPYLASVSVDNPVGHSITFTPAFGFCGNPRLSASLAWRELFSRFELSAAMIMGNVLCRSYVGKSQPLTSVESDALRDYIRGEGHEACSLEDDEIDLLYNKTHRYLDRVFTHSGVTSLARTLAQTLATRRTLSPGELLDILAPLNSM